MSWIQIIMFGENPIQLFIFSSMVVAGSCYGYACHRQGLGSFLLLNFTPFSPQFHGIQLFSSYYLVSSQQLPYGLGRDEGWKSCVLRYTTQAALLLNTAPSNPEASHTNVSEETPCTWQPWLERCTQPATGVAGARWDKDFPTGQTLPNPEDARPIVCRPTDLPVAAGYDRAWARTQSLWWHSWRCSTAPLTTAPPGRPYTRFFSLWNTLLPLPPIIVLCLPMSALSLLSLSSVCSIDSTLSHVAVWSILNTL